MFVVPAARRAKKLAIHIGADGPRQVSAMLDRQNLNGRTVSVRNLACGAIGCVGDAALPDDGNVCFFTGLPIHGPDIATFTDAGTAARLMPDYDGAFAGAFWDASRNKLVVVTDCLGMQPLYMRHVGDELTVVSETKAIRGNPDMAAWGAFILSGRPIGDRSLVDDLQRMPPASVLTFDCGTRQIDIRRYWDWPEPSERWRDYDFLDALERDIRDYAAFGEPGTLLLSGGFDSRLLLFLLKRAQIPADALSVVHQDEHDDADGRLAIAVARLVGTPHRTVYPRADFFSSSEYIDYLRASDVGCPSLDLFISKVASRIDSAAVWDGLTGPIFRAHYQPEGSFEDMLKPRIKGPDSLIWQAAKLLFAPNVLEAMFEGFTHDLHAEVARLPHDVYGMIRFVFENRIRNRPAMNTLKVYANRANVYTPGLSKEFLTHALVIPPAEKRHAKFYRALFARLDKRALSIPVVSGGELERGTGTVASYRREQLRIAANRYRTRHPSMFPGARRRPPERSIFLGEHLLEDDNRWLSPQIRENLATAGANSYVAWRLLFHWKAWKWVHEGRLSQMLGDRAAHAPARSAAASHQ